jgi:hypothetical protein
MFKKATKEKLKLRLALIGIAGTGKTYTALNIAKHIGGKIALVDTEQESACLYSDIFDFDTVVLNSYSVQNYISAIEEAEKLKYDTLIIDSLSHAWTGTDGILEYVESERLKSSSKNAYTAGWRKATPLHNKLIEKILRSNLHIVCTLRAKPGYTMDTDERGRTYPRKIGLQPLQREGLDHEFTITADMDTDHNLIVGKTRCHLIDNKIYNKAGKEFTDIVLGWLNSGMDKADSNPNELLRELVKENLDKGLNPVIQPEEIPELEEEDFKGIKPDLEAKEDKSLDFDFNDDGTVITKQDKTYEELLNACETTEELKDVWLTINKNKGCLGEGVSYRKLEEVKNLKKIEVGNKELDQQFKNRVA